jgi:twitching motility two-component system response regulator PilG
MAMALKVGASRANQLMREVVAATRLGQKSLARTLLKQLEEEDPDNEQALLWSAALAETPAEATRHLQEVLRINPNNQQAINVLAMHRLNPAAARMAPPGGGPHPAARPSGWETPSTEPAPKPPLTPQAMPPPPRATPPPAMPPPREAVSSPHSPAPARHAHPAPPSPPPLPGRLGEVPPPLPAARPLPPPPQATPTPESSPAGPASAPSPHVAPALPAQPTAAGAGSRVANFHELLKRHWQCPLCQAQAAQIQRKCPQCGALLALDDLQALAENRGADEKKLHEALDHWLKRVTVEPNFEGWLNLARIYFNLNRSAEALPCLKKACEMRPNETGLQMAVSRLEERRLLMAVDDSLTLRRILGIMLERHGYRVLTASDGMQALALLNEHTPDLILLDITMPRMDGYQVCKVIKQNPYTKHIPVVMLSGNDGFFDKVKGKLAGATDYITKPFEEAPLAASVQKHLKSHAKSGR